MNKLFLLGCPLEHSVSPQMQNAALQACGPTDWRYEAWSLPPHELCLFLDDRSRTDWVGANVTIPYKQSVLPWLDELSDAAREIGAVNTVLRRGDRLIGDNTDAYGLMQTLHGASVPLRGARVALFGAGGAARASAWALAREGIHRLVVMNRTPARGQALVAMLERRFPGLASLGNGESLQETDLVINATSLGMMPRVNESPLSDDQHLRAGTWVIDLVYNPTETRFLKQAAQMGAHALGGLEMLIQQGARAFEAWTERPAPLDIMREAARRAVEAALSRKDQTC